MLERYPSHLSLPVGFSFPRELDLSCPCGILTVCLVFVLLRSLAFTTGLEAGAKLESSAHFRALNTLAHDIMMKSLASSQSVSLVPCMHVCELSPCTVRTIKYLEQFPTFHNCLRT